jgi:uncharacterized protein Yka (UPF0111/DUF47 family)
MPFQRFIRWLMPQEDHFYTLIERHAVIAHETAKALAGYKAGCNAAEIRKSVQDWEHQGDAIVKQMIDSLAKTFVTPIDREDLQKLSKKIDDICDFINLAARDCVLYGVEQPTRPMLVLIEKLVASTAIMANEMPKLRQHAYREIIEISNRITAIKEDGDTVFTEALNALFHDPAIDAKVILREKEVLEAIEKAINRCEQVAETLTGIAVKHG